MRTLCPTCGRAPSLRIGTGQAKIVTVSASKRSTQTVTVDCATDSCTDPIHDLADLGPALAWMFGATSIDELDERTKLITDNYYAHEDDTAFDWRSILAQEAAK